MRHEYFMDGDTLMVEIECDPSSVVIRPATNEEIAAQKPPEKPKAKARTKAAR